jgi:hypothetical protein
MMMRRSMHGVWLISLLALGCGTDPPAPQTTLSPTTSDALVQPRTDQQSPSATAAGDTSGKTPDNMKVRPRLAHRAGGILDLTFDDLEFEIDRDGAFERSMLGEHIEELKDKTVILRGFILDASVFQQKGIKQFVLVRDNQQCCFGPGAYIHHNAQVEMVEGKSTEFSLRPVTVKGKFDIRPFLGPDGKCYSVYHLTAESVK